MIEHTPLIITLSMIAAFLVGLSKGGLPSVGAAAVPLLAIVMSPVLAAALLTAFGTLAQAGAISARDMTIEAVYAKLVFLLCQGLAAEEIAHWMVTDIAGELSS